MLFVRLAKQGGKSLCFACAWVFTLNLIGASCLVQIRPGEYTVELFFWKLTQELPHLLEQIRREVRLDLRRAPDDRAKGEIAEPVQIDAPALVARRGRVHDITGRIKQRVGHPTDPCGQPLEYSSGERLI